jgi:hypothetical protein
MSYILGSHKCPNCKQTFYWAGELNNQVDKDMQKQIAGNRDLRYAWFIKGTNKEFKVTTRCTYCHCRVEYDYDDNKKLLS